MTHHRHVVARISLDEDELVITVGAGRLVDLRIWENTAGVKLAGSKGFTIPQRVVPAVIDALKAATKRKAA
jgi:hypothetical protein